VVWTMALFGGKHQELKSFMTMHWASICIITLVGAIALGGMPQADALIIKEFSAKYTAAQQAGTLQGLRWNDFHKEECNLRASTAPRHLLPAPYRGQPP